MQIAAAIDTRTNAHPVGVEYALPIGFKRVDERTRSKTSINELLRD